MTITIDKGSCTTGLPTGYGKKPHYADWALPLVQLPDFDKSSGVYIIRNTINGRMYIGSAVSLIDRQNRHMRDLRMRCHKNFHLQCAWNKYGKRAFEWGILVRCSREDRIHYEQRCIDIYSNAFGFEWLYNFNKDAQSPKGMHRTEEVKRKISNSLKGRKHGPMSEEQKRKLSLAHMGQVPGNKGKKRESPPWNKGKKMDKPAWNKGIKCPERTEEAKRKTSETLKRKYAEGWRAEYRKK